MSAGMDLIRSIVASAKRFRGFYPAANEAWKTSVEGPAIPTRNYVAWLDADEDPSSVCNSAGLWGLAAWGESLSRHADTTFVAENMLLQGCMAEWLARYRRVGMLERLIVP